MSEQFVIEPKPSLTLVEKKSFYETMNRHNPPEGPLPMRPAAPREGDEEEGAFFQERVNKIKVTLDLKEDTVPPKKVEVVYKLRDANPGMVNAWNTVFGNKPYFNAKIEVSQGDIFRGAPAADAIVSPANSFGFMDGGIDMAFSRHFGWGMSERLRKMISEELDGELLVGNAVIIPTNGAGEQDPILHPDINEGQSIKWLISAPTMRVPMAVNNTVNAYLAFRAIILAVNRFNRVTDVKPIKSVLCSGLGTAVGKMPHMMCASQMLRAFETHELKINPSDLKPEYLEEAWKLHYDLIEGKV